jgi:hypothetical protein
VNERRTPRQPVDLSDVLLARLSVDALPPVRPAEVDRVRALLDAEPWLEADVVDAVARQLLLHPGVG